MSRNIDVSNHTIQSQNNQLELERETRRLEKLFYFFRDSKKKMNVEMLEEELTWFRSQNMLRSQELIYLVEQNNSKFLKRLDHMWNKFLVKQKCPKE